MPPREPPGGSGVGLQSLPMDIFKSRLLPPLAPEDKRNVRILNKNMRDRADACVTKQRIKISAGPSHLPSLQKQLTAFSQVETLIPVFLAIHKGGHLASGEFNIEFATGHDVARLFEACIPSSIHIKQLCFDGFRSGMGMALHSLPSSLRQTLEMLDLRMLGECSVLDGPAFLSLADCHSLTTLRIGHSRITSTEVAYSITCLLTQLRSLEITANFKVDVPLLPLLSMPGLTSLEVSTYSRFLGDVVGNLCWGSPMMSLEDMRPAALRRLALHPMQEVQPPGDRAAVLRLLPQLQELHLDDCALQDSDVEALAGLSALTSLEFAGPMELTRPHRLPILKSLCLSDRKHLLFYRISAGVPLRHLDWLIGGSTNLREIEYTAWGKNEPMECPGSMRLFISAMRKPQISTPLRSVSLALQQCGMTELHLETTGHGVGGRPRLLEPKMIEALAPLNETLKELHLFEFIVGEDAIRSISQQLTHVRTLCVNSCMMAEGSRPALPKADIVLEGNDEEEEE
eukprot:gene16897-23173_t